MSYSPLTKYCLRGLRSSWQESLGCFSYSHGPGPGSPAGGLNTSVPVSDHYYSLNVLLGLSKLPPQQGADAPDYPVDSIFAAACAALPRLGAPVYASAMALWVAARYQYELPAVMRHRLDQLLDPDADWTGWTGQDVGLMLSACAAMRTAGHGDYDGAAERLRQHISQRMCCTETGLFYNTSAGFRRRFASYATGVYLSMGLFDYGQAWTDGSAIDRALRCVRALHAHQGDQGEWPWFYDVPRNAIADRYQIYSVHQDGMAPAYLHLAEQHGFAEARQSIIKGFRWILGQNERRESMLVPEHGTIKRSMVRRDPLAVALPKTERLSRAARALRNLALGRASGRLPRWRTVVNPECRSYHLGWVLWSFAGREDYAELTGHTAFN